MSVPWFPFEAPQFEQRPSIDPAPQAVEMPTLRPADPDCASSGLKTLLVAW